MELIPPRRNQHEDRESFGSDYFPCSQSRKMSIGIMPQGEPHPTPAPASNARADPNTSTRPSSHKTPAPTMLPKTTTSAHGYGVLQKSNPVNSQVVHVYAKRSVLLQATNGLHTKFDGVAYGRSRQVGNSERVQEFAFAAAHQVLESDKGKAHDNNCANENTGSLKQKLWEALATVPSQVENSSDSKAVEADTHNLDHNNNTALKPKQSSDTIETDSQSPNATTRRPVTRSLTRRKTSGAQRTKLKSNIANGGNLPSTVPHRWGNQQKNIFNFKEEEEERQGTLNRPTNTSLTTMIEKMNNKIEPRRISFSGKRKPKKTAPGSNSGEGKVKDYKTTTCSTSVVEKSHSNPSQNSRDNLLSESRTRKEELRNSSDSKEEIQKGEFSCPELTKKSSPLKNLPSSSLKKNSIPECDTDSPTLGIKANTNSYVFNPASHKSIQMEQGIQSPAPDKARFTSKGFYNLRTLQRSKRGFCGFNAEADSSEDINDLKKSLIKESTPVMEDIGATHKSSQSSEDQEKESLEDEHIYKDAGCSRREVGTAGFSNAEESPVTIHTSKKLRRNGLCCLSPSQKGTMEIDELLQPSDQTQEDGLMRAVSLLVIALERFKTRIRTQTNKKSSEIVTSLGEGIQLQLQSANTQIQKDVLKLTNHGKSKRKTFETRFQEQHEKLKSMHNKFKEEVAQHLQECKRTLEDLEAFQIELKGDAKRQKVLHQKLIVQVEKAIETQLSEADRRITSMHEVAREKMYQLRHVIAECLKDGVFS